MATRLREAVWIGKDNAIDLQLLEDGVAKDISATTRAVLTLIKSGVTDIVIDSAVESGVFDWSTAGATGKLTMKLGGVSSLVAGTYKARLELYDAGNANGIVWVGTKTPTRLTIEIRT